MNKKFMSIGRIILIALILSSVVSAATACEVATNFDFSTSGNPTSADNNWKTWSVIGLLISGSLIALVFMFGKAFGNISLINRAKTDINQFLITAVILVAFTAFIGAVCSIDGTQIGLPTESLFESAHSYLEYTQRVSMRAYVKSTDAIMLLSGLSSIYVSASNALPSMAISFTLSTQPFSGFAVMIGPLQLLSNFVQLFVMVTSGYQIILSAIENWFLNLLFPIGIVLRTFTPTREVGGVFMSIAIGLFLFYPLMLSLSYLIIKTPLPSSVNISSEGHTTKVFSEVLLFSVAAFIPWALPAILSAQMPFMSGLAGDVTMEALKGAGEAVMPAFILPAISWIIVIMAVRWMSKAMGEEVDISSLARLI